MEPRPVMLMGLREWVNELWSVCSVQMAVGFVPGLALQSAGKQYQSGI